ncbi:MULTISPECIES: hypothetical protein [unclassified Campylobacter]|nr:MULTISPECIES: hypothetical protein [unclassified Campylobacter]KAA6226513.1 hypothetical protein FMM55_05145 [Campylobacter sp. LR196d]KAA6227004.1 hypothetical protein FMM54_03205 [Campylobacter sp. LR185c]KAA6228159.1 hypothetical protein FMM57_03160 [Campylobacter sp. LR286c]KAA6229981.1 hypothetical protein FMM58_06770 [Campylobacter sp. LR291e]KAA8603175.1 hypothetical protein CGP82_08560 [Campylobacter sp. LR185c]
MFYNHFELIDDSPSKLPELETFIQNRHDQSIWSIINKRERLQNYDLSFIRKIIPDARNKIYLSNNMDETINTYNNIRKDLKALESKEYKTHIELSKEIINDLKDLKFEFKFGTAKQRVQNHLSYKLGRAMIENSHSLWGLIKIPFILRCITKKHKQNLTQNSLPLSAYRTIKKP